jgi:hypothetical protein
MRRFYIKKKKERERGIGIVNKRHAKIDRRIKSLADKSKDLKEL